MAVDFGRRMYAAIHGQPAPVNLEEATDRAKGDVGVWARYWRDHVVASIPADAYERFAKRCETDITKKKKTKGIRNLGGLARKTIVPGVLVVVAKGTGK